MKNFKRILVGLLALLVALILFIVIYLQTQKPIYDGELKLSGLKEEVEVHYDDFGVPHIYAKNEEDAYLALGYVHAQDRLFQMEMLRRAAGGNLSEVLGTDFIKIDELFRTLGINQFAKEQAAKFMSGDASPAQRAALAYQKGVNEYVRTGETPVEFRIMGIPKNEFKPEDVYLAIGFMSLGFAEGFQADPILQKIKTEWGTEYLKDLAVETPADAARINSFDGQQKSSTTDSLITFIHEALQQLPVPLFQGSNGWVVSGDRTQSGFPILANDTHIGFAQPAVWYEAHIEYPGFRLYGHYLAGIPFALLGNNDQCGWGITMFENDDMDFFLETVNPDDSSQVKFKDQWEALTFRDEVIKIKGKDDKVLKVKSSRHGSIINAIIETLDKKSQPVALSWTLTQNDNQAGEAFYILNHAKGITDAEKAASMIASPGLNIMYGDVHGNIAWWAVAKLPIRPDHFQSKFFLDGASGNDEYLGYYDFSKNPHAVNPPWQYVYSANNQPDSVDGILYPGYYFPKSRSGRIVQLLSENKKWTSDDMKAINLDVVSITHPAVAKEMALVLKSVNKEEYQDLINQLENWNGNHKATDTAPSVYYNMLSQIMYASMIDELGGNATKALLGSSIIKNSYLMLLQNNLSPWWDDVRTKDLKETRANIIQRAADKTLELLKKNCGEKPGDWVWGKIHTLTHEHPLGAVKPMDKIFNVGPFSVDGGSEVLNNLSFSLDTTGYFKVDVGPALRKITDFSSIENGETISPTGQSGNVMSEHYDDQAEMFATGKFRRMLMNREEIEGKSKKLLLLKVK
ncbi:MAG TPA: penicillin acylase family protein [Chryseolinea sp.]|nr:penicillin acylase family protein [Chryseolinea sp.]